MNFKVSRSLNQDLMRFDEKKNQDFMDYMRSFLVLLVGVFLMKEKCTGNGFPYERKLGMDLGIHLGVDSIDRMEKQLPQSKG